MPHPLLGVLVAPLIATITGLGMAQTLALPPRPPGAPTGSELVPMITDLSWSERELVLCDQITSGNVPDFLRDLVAITVNRSGHVATFYVTPDYLALGTDDDYFLMPMTPILGQWLADFTGCCLPTRRIVNDVYAAATVKLAPQPIAPSPEMITVPVFDQHNTIVWGQRSAVLGTHPLGELVGGTKKDVVITPLLHDGAHDNRVAIYGWHQLDGTPIQNLYLGHVDWYADYSHGIRLVQSAMTVDGLPTTVQAVLANPNLAVLLSDEGVVTTPRYNVAPPPEGFPYIDSFPSTGRELSSWIDRFTTPEIIAMSPISPGGDGHVLRVRDPAGGIDTTRLGSATDSECSVVCDIYCELRPFSPSEGFERLGIFARDDGNGMFEGTNLAGTIRGSNYALTWDSLDGRVQCLRTIDGVPTDLLPMQVFRPTTGWREFRIDAFGDDLTFVFDGEVILQITDTTHPSGQCGIGYHDYFTNNANIIGTRADNFAATETPGPLPSTLSGLLQR
ncbi:hypothetical protein JXA47_12180 [Candidatus Sumerlaeota bacterium]|nr:hypothetical protein [Candidatus Sumerlaeota bacterium]